MWPGGAAWACSARRKRLPQAGATHAGRSHTAFPASAVTLPLARSGFPSPPAPLGASPERPAALASSAQGQRSKPLGFAPACRKGRVGFESLQGCQKTGKGGIRTLGIGFPIQRISSPLPSATRPPFQKTILELAHSSTGTERAQPNRLVLLQHGSIG